MLATRVLSCTLRNYIKMCFCLDQKKDGLQISGWHLTVVITSERDTTTREQKLFLLLPESDGATRLAFPPPDVTVKASCSCPAEVRIQGNDQPFFRPLFFFPLLWRGPAVSLLWLMEPADLSRHLKIFSLCLQLVILPVFVPWAQLILTESYTHFWVFHFDFGLLYPHSTKISRLAL